MFRRFQSCSSSRASSCSAVRCDWLEEPMSFFLILGKFSHITDLYSSPRLVSNFHATSINLDTTHSLSPPPRPSHAKLRASVQDRSSFSFVSTHYAGMSPINSAYYIYNCRYLLKTKYVSLSYIQNCDDDRNTVKNESINVPHYTLKHIVRVGCSKRRLLTTIIRKLRQLVGKPTNFHIVITRKFSNPTTLHATTSSCGVESGGVYEGEVLH